MQQLREFQSKQFRIRHPPLENRRGSPISPTSMSFSTGSLRCQGRTKSRIFDYSTFSKSDRQTRNLKLTRQLNWTSGTFFFPFLERNVFDWDHQAYGMEQQRTHNQPAPPPRLLISGHRIVRSIHQMLATQHSEHTIVRSYL